MNQAELEALVASLPVGKTLAVGAGGTQPVDLALLPAETPSVPGFVPLLVLERERGHVAEFIFDARQSGRAAAFARGIDYFYATAESPRSLSGVHEFASRIWEWSARDTFDTRGIDACGITVAAFETWVDSVRRRVAISSVGWRTTRTAKQILAAEDRRIERLTGRPGRNIHRVGRDALRALITETTSHGAN